MIEWTEWMIGTFNRESLMQEYSFHKFYNEEHNDFLNNVFLTLIDKRDPFDGTIL